MKLRVSKCISIKNSFKFYCKDSSFPLGNPHYSVFLLLLFYLRNFPVPFRIILIFGYIYISRRDYEQCRAFAALITYCADIIYISNLELKGVLKRGTYVTFTSFYQDERDLFNLDKTQFNGSVLWIII